MKPDHLSIGPCAESCGRRRAPTSGLLALTLLGMLTTAPAFAADAGLMSDSADRLTTDMPASLATASAVRVAGTAVQPALTAADVNRLIAADAVRPAPAAPADTRTQSLLKRALALLGTPYRWGGETTDGFDCSGLVGYVFRSALGIELPRVSREMATNGEKIDRASLTAGDLVFFSRRGKRVDHVGIYVGNGNFVHAPRRGRDVTVSSLSDGYWSKKFMQARRVPGV